MYKISSANFEALQRKQKDIKDVSEEMNIRCGIVFGISGRILRVFMLLIVSY